MLGKNELFIRYFRCRWLWQLAVDVDVDLDVGNAER
jgi:hypothetical protein